MIEEIKEEKTEQEPKQRLKEFGVTAGQLMSEAFSEVTNGFVRYCEWIYENNLRITLMNKILGVEENDFPQQYDCGIPALRLG